MSVIKLSSADEPSRCRSFVHPLYRSFSRPKRRLPLGTAASTAAFLTALLLLGCDWVFASVPEASSDNEDRVVLRSEDNGEARVRTGKILKYDAKQLELQTTAGPRRTYSANEIESVSYDKSEAHQAAEVALVQGRYDEAAEALGAAIREETRVWVQRELLAWAAQVALYRQQPQVACRYFRELLRLEPNHRHWDAMPLPWRTTATPPGLTAEAQAWLASNRPAEVLLGAAWLLGGADQKQATDKLRELSRTDTGPIGRLAEAQLWRLQVDVADDRLAAWQSRLEKFPSEIRGGPRYLLGRAAAREKDLDRAARYFWQVRILHPRQLELNAMALWQASRVAETAGYPGEQQRAERELQQQFPDSSWAQQF